jgi:uncharacterized protein YceH (UPF0502 family)/2-methylisocitrate lyase-like PEP mutase family enzyme
MERDLSSAEVRTLGALIEKELTTPDQYPLSTNSLRAACNQKTSREPVMALAEADVDASVMQLRERGLARSLKPQGSRAWKHRHVITEVLPLDPAQVAVLAVLALRGAQTPGELRQRTDRMYPFEDVDEVDSALRSLADREEPLVRCLGREPGQSQDRWAHCLSEGAVPAEASRQRAMAHEFRALHQSGFFVLPNPWDRGSARIMEGLGAVALATTSAGFGRAIGKDDQEVTRDELVEHVHDLASFADVPLNVDSERLFPTDPGGIGRTVDLLAEAGAAGVSIEDFDPATSSIVSIDEATAAVREAVVACDRHDIVLTARAENYLYDKPDLDDTITRLLAFKDAGAEALYAPGVQDADDIELIVTETGAPINVLAIPGTPSLEALAAMGVRRASTGSIISNAARAAAMATAAEFLAR